VADPTELLEYAPLVTPPSLDELRRVAVRRRRRAATALTSTVVAAGLALVLAIDPVGLRGAAPAPVAPEPSRTPSAPSDTSRVTPSPEGFPSLSPEQIRRHPDAASESIGGLSQAAGRGVGARLWTVCLDECTLETPDRAGELQRALEVTRDGFRSAALYPAGPPDPNISHAIEDWYLIDTFDRSVLVNSQGEVQALTFGDPVEVTEIGGPLVYSMQGVAYVDLETRRLHRLEGDGYWDWGRSSDSWFWGSVSMSDDSGRQVRQGVTWRNPDGTFGVRMLPFGGSRIGFQMLRSGVPGTMAALDFGWPRMMHVSTDYGATWDVLETPLDALSGSRLPAEWRTWPRA
jgi:hypothetical protein